jgi:thioredoxin reductase
MPGNVNYDLIIEGGGPAGLTARIYAMRTALKTVLIEQAALAAAHYVETRKGGQPC